MRGAEGTSKSGMASLTCSSNSFEGKSHVFSPGNALKHSETACFSFERAIYRAATTCNAAKRRAAVLHPLQDYGLPHLNHLEHPRTIISTDSDSPALLKCMVDAANPSSEAGFIAFSNLLLLKSLKCHIFTPRFSISSLSMAASKASNGCTAFLQGSTARHETEASVWP